VVRNTSGLVSGAPEEFAGWLEPCGTLPARPGAPVPDVEADAAWTASDGREEAPGPLVF
jgi:hypothetical protein